MKGEKCISYSKPVPNMGWPTWAMYVWSSDKLSLVPDRLTSMFPSNGNRVGGTTSSTSYPNQMARATGVDPFSLDFAHRTSLHNSPHLVLDLGYGVRAETNIVYKQFFYA